MNQARKRVAVMLELGEGLQRHTKVFSGILPYARRQHWEVIIDEFADDTLAQCATGDAPYDGVIARATVKLADHARRLGLPVVNVWRNSAARVPSVFADLEKAGRLRAEHLVLRGLRHFAVLTGKSLGHRLGLKGFSDHVRGAGMECSASYISVTPSANLRAWRKAEHTISEWIDAFEPPIGVYVGADEVARIVIQTCLNRGLRIPEEVAVVGGSNEISFCEGLSPSLTSVELGLDRIGHEASALLGRLMDGEPSPTRSLLLPPIGLVARQSTDFFSVADELVAAALRYIASHSHRPIGPGEVAEAVGARPRTLQHRFKQCLDRGVATEVRRVRVERAKRELTYGDRSIADIARAVGFGSRIQLHQVFQREMGVSPGAYRKQSRSA